MEFPHTTIRVDVIDINSNEIIIHHDVQLYNPNSFEVIFQDIQIVATTTTGEEVTNLTIDGGSIPSQSNRSFASNGSIVMKGNLSELLTSKLTGIVGIDLLGIIKKTIPMEITILTSLKEALKNISLPTIIVRTEFENITRDAINITTEIDVTNPNPFDFFIDHFIVDITTETGTEVGNFVIQGSQIPADNSITFQGSGTVIIEALNAKKLYINLQAEAGINIAGVEKSLPISSMIEITVPDFNEFIPSDKPLELELKPDLQLAQGELKSKMTLEVINPTKIPFFASNIVVTYYGVTDNKKYYITEGSLGSGEFIPESTTYFYGEALLPYSKIINLTGQVIFPEMIFARLSVKLFLSGTNLSVPVSIGSYIDMKPFSPT